MASTISGLSALKAHNNNIFLLYYAPWLLLQQKKQQCLSSWSATKLFINSLWFYFLLQELGNQWTIWISCKLLNCIFLIVSVFPWFLESKKKNNNNKRLIQATPDKCYFLLLNVTEWWSNFLMLPNDLNIKFSAMQLHVKMHIFCLTY